MMEYTFYLLSIFIFSSILYITRYLFLFFFVTKIAFILGIKWRLYKRSRVDNFDKLRLLPPHCLQLVGKNGTYIRW